MDPHQFDADAVPDPACHFDADVVPDPACPVDADPYPTFHFVAYVLDPDPHFLYILACHLQVDADLDPAYHFCVDPDPRNCRMYIVYYWLSRNP